MTPAVYILVRALNAIAALFFLYLAVSRLQWFGPGGSTDLPWFVALGGIFVFNTVRSVSLPAMLRWFAIAANGCLVAIGAAAAVFGIIDPIGLFFAVAILPASAGTLLTCLYEARHPARRI